VGLKVQRNHGSVGQGGELLSIDGYLPKVLLLPWGISRVTLEKTSIEQLFLETICYSTNYLIRR
jgi:hypothetical protein